MHAVPKLANSQTVARGKSQGIDIIKHIVAASSGVAWVRHCDGDMKAQHRAIDGGQRRCHEPKRRHIVRQRANDRESDGEILYGESRASAWKYVSGPQRHIGSAR